MVKHMTCQAALTLSSFLPWVSMAVPWTAANWWFQCTPLHSTVTVPDACTAPHWVCPVSWLAKTPSRPSQLNLIMPVFTLHSSLLCLHVAPTLPTQSCSWPWYYIRKILQVHFVSVASNEVEIVISFVEQKPGLWNKSLNGNRSWILTTFS